VEEKVYEIFKLLNIEYEKINHPALVTCEDIEKYKVKIDGVDCKNLFIRNKDKSKYYLVCLPVGKRANLKELEEKLNETRLSFGNEEMLYEKLKITKGSVSLLNIIEVEKTDVKFIIDQSLIGVKKVGFHPNVNTATILFPATGIDKIMQYYNVEYKFVKL
jgi:Uncharacterized conserved protein